MAVKYYLQPYTLSKDKNANRARVIVNDSNDMDSIVDNMAQRGTTFGHAEITGFMELLSEVIADELARGNTVNLPFVKIRPAVKGVFNDAEDTFDATRHEVVLNYWHGMMTNAIVSKIKLEKAVKPLPIPELFVFTDTRSGTSNSVFNSGGIAKVGGKQLDFNMQDPEEGIFFIHNNGQQSKVDIIAHRTKNNLVFAVPLILATGDYILEIRKKYGKSGMIRKGRLPYTLTLQE